MSAVPLEQQIRAVQREIALRARVYPGLVAGGKMRAGEADHEQAAMAGVLATLEFISLHQALIRSAVAAERNP